MRTIKGPGLCPAQDTPPHDSLDAIARWAGDDGYAGIQGPGRGRRSFDRDRAFESGTSCDAVRGRLADIGIAVTELSTHVQGQMVSVHPAYGARLDGQAPAAVRGDLETRCLWAVPDRVFDDFVATRADAATDRRLLGIGDSG